MGLTLTVLVLMSLCIEPANRKITCTNMTYAGWKVIRFH